MAFALSPLPLPTTADPSRFINFGREVKGVHPGHLSPEEFVQVRDALYKHDALLFRDVLLTPEEQYALTQAFEPQSQNYGHGNNKTQSTQSPVLHLYLKTIPRVPQVQIIGNGTIYNDEGLVEANLKVYRHL